MIFSLLASALMTVATQAPPPPPPPLITVRPAPFDKAKLEKGMRAANACRRAYVGQDYLPQPAIWKIADGDTSIHLIGTSHILPMGFEWRTAQLDGIVAGSRLLITESGLPTSPTEFETQLKSLAPVGVDGRHIPIADRLSGEQRAKWMGMAAMLPEEMVAKLTQAPTWMVTFGIGFLAGRGKTPAYVKGVDHQLEMDFKKAGKPVAAMEDPKSVIASLSQIPESTQRAMLSRTLDRAGQPVTLAERMARHHAWAKGEPVVFTRGAASPDDAFFDEVRERLLDTRNAAWVHVVKQGLAEPGAILIAVGAAHMWGDEALIDLLAKQGIKAERVSPTSAAKPRAKFLPTPATWKECDRYMFGRAVPMAGAD